MLKGTITYFDGQTIGVTIGLGEDVKAPRDLAALEKQGLVINDDIVAGYKAFLAGKRQGDIASDAKYIEWCDTVADIEIFPSRRNIEQAVVLGQMDKEQADGLIQLMESGLGEAKAQPGE